MILGVKISSDDKFRRSIKTKTMAQKLETLNKVERTSCQNNLSFNTKPVAGYENKLIFESAR